MPAINFESYFFLFFLLSEQGTICEGVDPFVTSLENFEQSNLVKIDVILNPWIMLLLMR